MAQDGSDLICSPAEKDKISAVLVGIAGFDPNVVPWKALSDGLFAFVPEAISGAGGVPQAVLLLVKFVLAH